MEEAMWMERAFEESEVFDVVKALNKDKALGLIVFRWPSSSLVVRSLKKIS